MWFHIIWGEEAQLPSLKKKKKESSYSVSYTISEAALYFWALTYLIGPWISHSFVFAPPYVISICDLHIFITGTPVFLIQATAWQLYDFSILKNILNFEYFLSLTDLFFF